MAIGPVDSSFYADPTSLSSLKREAQTQSPETLREVARQFESLFTTMMLKSMRQASPGESLFGSEQQDFYQDMFDQQMSVQLSKGKGIGLADMLVQQLMKQQGMEGETAISDLTGVSKAGKPPSFTSATWPPQNRDEFVQAILPAAREAGRKLGVDPMTVVAHAALETGWGKSLPASGESGAGFNLFGIKAGRSWNGAATEATTFEFSGGKMNEVAARFRAYDSPEHCLDDYAQLLSRNPRYADALGTGSDATAFATALKKGGYATDPDYVNKLSSVARELKSRFVQPIQPSSV